MFQSYLFIIHTVIILFYFGYRYKTYIIFINKLAKILKIEFLVGTS